ncbi:hypothetical protein NDU88_002700 [Pleurodeles waltl]|uniref:Uncharacterized protein n=1 Tax=Pleurodeles waltl TaxID=8319 RepID=A0AAV7L475_PLEWA|nr:hypothetical protein NDU88_002700 [Pleurodeles waltl]
MCGHLIASEEVMWRRKKRRDNLEAAAVERLFLCKELPQGTFADHGRCDGGGGTAVEWKLPGERGNDGGYNPVSHGSGTPAGEEEDGGMTCREMKKCERRTKTWRLEEKEDRRQRTAARRIPSIKREKMCRCRPCSGKNMASSGTVVSVNGEWGEGLHREKGREGEGEARMGIIEHWGTLH